MDIINTALSDIVPYAANAKKHDQTQINNVAQSIKKYGFVQPIVIDRDGVIVIGHCRALAAKKLGMTEVPCVCVDDLTPEQVNALRLVDNKSNESDWDFDLLADELSSLDLSAFDFDWGIKSEKDKYADKVPGHLRDLFIQPPFSVLDARSGSWQARKKAWHTILQSVNGRRENLLGGGLQELAKSTDSSLTGTSIFDPCLCEILVNWFSPKGGKIIDPFAGGSVRGIVSQFLDREYHGCDLSANQIAENEKGFDAIDGSLDFFGERLKRPKWYNGDSSEIDSIISGEDFDALITCPPYADLEVYSDDPRDISNMEYEDFLRVYETILHKTISKLKDNSFVCVVVGEVRDKQGYYRNFIGDTVAACEKAGAKYYNEIVLVTMGGTARLRCRKAFEASRKVCNVHQKALVFLKNPGDKKALCQYIADFERDRYLTPMKESILVFLKGNAKSAAGEIENYDFPEFSDDD